jgi:hypothetical protein
MVPSPLAGAPFAMSARIISAVIVFPPALVSSSERDAGDRAVGFALLFDCLSCNACNCPWYQVVDNRPELSSASSHRNPFGSLRRNHPQQLLVSTPSRNPLKLIGPSWVERATRPSLGSSHFQAVVGSQSSASPIIQGLPMKFTRQIRVLDFRLYSFHRVSSA